MESYEIIWKNALVEIEKNVSGIAFSTYIEPLKAIDLDNGAIVLQAPNQMFAKFITRLSDTISTALKNTADISEFKIYVAGANKPFFSSHKDEDASLCPINPKYTFDNFVVGESNRFLYAAAKAVSEETGTLYNPLFIYGSTGLGKTHIMHAIANSIKSTNPHLNIIYSTCEKFVTDLIRNIRNGKAYSDNENFRNKYRNVDVLIIDDIQFLAKKEVSQEEFFNTFNELYANNKQIILSADCHPSKIELLEDRLKTRFSSGLMAEVLPPDIETKIAILQKKAEERKNIIGMEVASYIAENCADDVRSLEGLLNKVIFASKLKEVPITLELVKDAIELAKPSQQGQEEKITTDYIINTVCNFYKIEKTDLLGKKKNKEFVEPRQICTYLITELMDIPLVSIGQAMGGRDYTTVIYTRDKISDAIKLNSRIATEVNDLKNLIKKK